LRKELAKKITKLDFKILSNALEKHFKNLFIIGASVFQRCSIFWSWWMKCILLSCIYFFMYIIISTHHKLAWLCLFLAMYFQFITAPTFKNTRSYILVPLHSLDGQHLSFR
jgi:hypothetical protein